MSVIARVADQPTFNCPCGRVWAPWTLNGQSNQYAAVVAGRGATVARTDGHFTCHCGQGFDLIRRKDLPTIHAV